jgi:hypothetical protein
MLGGEELPQLVTKVKILEFWPNYPKNVIKEMKTFFSSVTCDKLTPTNGKITYSDDQNYDSTATHSCNEGFELIGSATQKCGNAGWSGSALTCEKGKYFGIFAELSQKI